MKTAHVYLFTNVKRTCWRVRICTPPSESYRVTVREAGPFPSAVAAMDAMQATFSHTHDLVYKPTKSVPMFAEVGS